MTDPSVVGHTKWSLYRAKGFAMTQPSLPASTSTPNTFAADYPSLFGDQGIDRCPDEALESSFGPFAYADALMVIVRRLEANFGTPPASPLAIRQPMR